MTPDKLYILIDEILTSLEHKSDKRANLSDTEILFVYITACQYFCGNYSKTLCFLSVTNLIKGEISRSRFSRRLNQLKDLILVVFKVMSEIGKSEADYFQMDGC